MKKGVKAAIFVIAGIAGILSLILALGVFEKRIYLSPGAITYGNMEEFLSSVDLVKELPSDGVIWLRFYNYNAGTREWENSYTLARGSAQKGVPDSRDITMYLHSRYIEQFGTDDFCNVLGTASMNNDLAYDFESSELTLLWKFGGMLNKFKTCFEAPEIPIEAEFSRVSEGRVENLVIKDKIRWRIKFFGTIDIPETNLNPSMLSRAVEIGPAKVKIDTNILPQLKNFPAELTLNDINFMNPKILYNGNVCSSDVCTSSYYDRVGGVFSFNVSGFSEFQVIESQSYCGDGLCQAYAGENCGNCQIDCGVCSQNNLPNCAPVWNCSWSRCMNGQQSNICVKIDPSCLSEAGRPASEARSCFQVENCSDNDGDGYGIGADCLGSDLDDNNARITDEPNATRKQKPAPEDEKTGKYMLWIIIGAVLAVVIILEVAVLARRKGGSEQFSEKGINEKAREYVANFRSSGYTDQQIKDSFKENGWTDSDIDSILNS